MVVGLKTPSSITPAVRNCSTIRRNPDLWESSSGAAVWASSPINARVISLEHSNADFVDSRRPTVPLDVTKGCSHPFGSDPSRQRMHLDLFAHDEPFTHCNHRVRKRELWGTFLSTS